MSDFASVPTMDFNTIEAVHKANHISDTKLIVCWAIGALAIIVVSIIIFYGSYDECESFSEKETMEGSADDSIIEDNSRFASCPDGYLLHMGECIPDPNTKIVQTCPDGGFPIPENGLCRQRVFATCPDGYTNDKSKCYDEKTKTSIPFSDTMCPEGMTLDGAICTKSYVGACPTNFINSQSGLHPCKHEYESISPQCGPNEKLNGSRCYPSSSTEAFVKANEIEALAIASLNI